MRHDRPATVADQCRWLADAGLVDVDCFYKAWRFAVFGGRRRPDPAAPAEWRFAARGRPASAGMTVGHTEGRIGGMTAKVTLSFSDETIEEARRFAKREGLSLSAWMDQAAREKALREVFTAHAEAVGRAGLDLESAALADAREVGMVDDVLFGGRPRAA